MISMSMCVISLPPHLQCAPEVRISDKSPGESCQRHPLTLRGWLVARSWSVDLQPLVRQHLLLHDGGRSAGGHVQLWPHRVSHGELLRGGNPILVIILLL